MKVLAKRSCHETHVMFPRLRVGAKRAQIVLLDSEVLV